MLYSLVHSFCASSFFDLAQQDSDRLGTESETPIPLKSKKKHNESNFYNIAYRFLEGSVRLGRRSLFFLLSSPIGIRKGFRVLYPP